jgi:hypothetical protein
MSDKAWSNLERIRAERSKGCHAQDSGVAEMVLAAADEVSAIALESIKG